MKQKRTSQTDFMEPVYSNDSPPPPGFDICGRKVLKREEDGIEFDMALAAYRKRTGLKLNVNVWSFPQQDLPRKDAMAGEYRNTGRIINETARATQVRNSRETFGIEAKESGEHVEGRQTKPNARLPKWANELPPIEDGIELAEPSPELLAKLRKDT